MKKKAKKKTKEISTDKVLNQMIQWAFECGKILNTHLISSYEKPLKILDKGKQGLATEADILSEKYVMAQINKHFPHHHILSEEDAFQKNTELKDLASTDYLWLIDPLDGTNNFYNKVPFFAVSLALTQGGKALIGVVYNPVTCELFYAVKGKGAYLIRLIGDQEVRTRLKSKKVSKTFKEALLSANLTKKRVENDKLKMFPEVRGMRRLGSAALEMSYVAAGMLDAYWEQELQPWDMAAAGLICQEAGVKISTMKGEAYHPFCKSLLVSHPTLYPELKSILNGKK